LFPIPRLGIVQHAFLVEHLREVSRVVQIANAPQRGVGRDGLDVAVFGPDRREDQPNVAVDVVP
jgi:hypothetical protein